MEGVGSATVTYCCLSQTPKERGTEQKPHNSSEQKPLNN